MACIHHCWYTLLMVLLLSPSFRILTGGIEDGAVYIGCFQDFVVRALNEGHLKDTHDMSHSMCFTLCRSSLSPYAGLQDAKHCYCGDNYNKYGALEDSLCYAPCTGNSEEICGGGWANSIYLLVYSHTVCETEILNLDCGGHYVGIESASYGVIPGDTNNPCYSEVLEICQSPSSLSVLQYTCQGKHTCNVSATNQVFGDPCVGVPKYLSVSYVCLKYPPDVIATTISSGQIYILLNVEPRLAENVQEPIVVQIHWQFTEPVESIEVYINWGDGNSTEEDVPAGWSGDRSFRHIYGTCGCFDVIGEVTGDDYQLYYEDVDVCLMDKITSLDVDVQDETGRIIESGSATSLNVSLALSVSVSPEGTTCHATSWEMVGPDGINSSSSAGPDPEYRLQDCGIYTLSVSAENKVSFVTSNVLIYVLSEMKMVCDSQSSVVGVPVTCLLEMEDCKFGLQVELDFGDQSTEVSIIMKGEYSSKEVQYTYQDAGIYNITVRVGNDVQATQLVTISEGPCLLTATSIRGISNHDSSPTVFTRNSKVYLGSTIELSCSLEALLIVHWELHAVSESVESVYHLPVSVLVNQTDLVIPPKILNFGYYRILLQVTLEDEEGGVLGQRDAQGWMMVARSDLIAHIDGGSQRTVGQSSTITLDGSSSYDPDFGDSHQFDPGLILSWSCLPVTGSSVNELNNINCDGSTISNSSVFVITQGSVLAPQTLAFQLRLEKGNGFAIAKQLLVFVTGDLPQIAVRCLQNCGIYLIPSSNLVLQASCMNCLNSEEIDVSYSWKIFQRREESQEGKRLKRFNWRENSLTGQNQNYLVLRTQALMELRAGMYHLEASGTYEGDTSRAEYSFGLSTPPVNGTCLVTPGNGKVLETKFTVICEGYMDVDEPLSYSLYRIDSQLGIDTLVSTYDGAISPSFYLPMGNESDGFSTSLMVKISDVYGCSTYSYLSVKVLPILTTSGSALGEHLLNLTSGSMSMFGNLLTSGSREAANQVMVSVATILNDASQRDESDTIDVKTRIQIRETLVDSLSTMTVQTPQDVLQTSSSLSLLTEASEELSPHTQVRAVSVIASLTSIMKHAGASTNDFTSQEAELAATMLVTGLSNIFQAALFNGGDNDTEPDSLTSYHQRGIILSGISSIDTMQDILVANKVSGERATSIKTPMFILSVSRLSTTQMAAIETSTTSHGIGQFRLPGGDDFYRNLTNNRSDVAVDIQLVELPSNPFIWSSNLTNHPTVTSGVMGLKLKTEGKEVTVSGLKDNPISIILKQPPEEVSPEVFHVTAGSVVGLNISTNGNVEAFDDLVQISLVPSTPGIPVSGCIYGNSSSENNTDNGDHCLQTFSLPHQSTDATASMESLYTWMGEVSLPDDQILHLEVRVGELPKPEDWYQSNLSLSVYSSSPGCMFWDEIKETWSNRGCRPGPMSDPWYTHCLCNHLSFFGSTMLVRPNKIDLIADAKLFLTFVENPLVVSTVAVIFGGYLLIAVWAYRKDKMDILKAQVTILEDNDPYDHYRYLVTVVTGWRRGASTTATVTLTLHGRKKKCQPHMLRKSFHPVLEAGAHDTFLLTTQGSLGQVTTIRLWHDNGGAHPEWYLSRIIVHDLETDSHYLFICNRWLASTMDDGKVDRTFDVATPEKLGHFGNLLSSKTTDDFQDGHLWFSVLSRPPRSSFTRVQRVSCCFSLLMTATMTNIMFYGIPSSPGEQVLDFGAVRITMQEIIIGIEASIIAFPINFAIVSLFRYARPPQHPDPSELYKLGAPQRDGEAEMSGSTEGSDVFLSIDESEFVYVSDSRRAAIVPSESGYPSTTADYHGAAISPDTLRCIITEPYTNVCSRRVTWERNLKDSTDQMDYISPGANEGSIVNRNVFNDGIRLMAEREGTNDGSIANRNVFKDGIRLMAEREDEGEDESHNILLYSKLIGMVRELEEIGPGRFSSEREYQKALSEARALVLTAVSVATPSSSSFDTSSSIGLGEDGPDGRSGGDDRWSSWLRKQPQTVKKRDVKKGIPHACVYLGWLLLLATCLISGYVTMLYGLKYGKQRSLDWLISLFVSTLQSIFITQPLKIILLAVFISMIFRQWEVDDGGTVNLDVEEKDLDNAAEVHRKLVQIKKDDVRYQPPQSDEVDKHRILKDHQKNMYGLLQEIVGYLIFVWLLVIITYSRRDRYAYYMTQNIRNRYFDGNKLYNVNLTHFAGFFQWTETTLLPNLYSTSDYEGDTQSTLLGGVRIRQLRVSPDTCTVVPVAQNAVAECWPPYTRQWQDTRQFNHSWQHLQTNHLQDAFNPWGYQKDISSPFGGRVTFYTEGGYVWYLGDTMATAEEEVKQMKCSRWLDKSTRAIFVDWTVFNANINMFGVVTCLLETPAGGGMLKTFAIHSVRLYRTASNTSLFVTLCEACFTFSLLYYTFRNYKQWVAQRGAYWQDSWNWLEVMIIVNALLMIALYITQLVFIKHLFEEFRRRPGQFHDFRRGAMMENNLTYSSAFLVILITIKFLHLLRLNPRMYLLTSVVFRSSSEVLGFMLMIVLLICTFSLFFTLYIGSQVMNYRSFIASFITLYNTIPGNFDVEEIRPVARIFGPWATFVFQYTSYFLFLDLLISALNDNMKHVRQNPQMSKDGIMGLILISKVLSFLGIRKKVKTDLA